MSVSAKVIADSVSPAGVRLTTFEITAHRYILSEINTHRMLSRNFRSSRAVPVKKLLEEVRSNPARPVRWGSNKPGMSAGDDLIGNDLLVAQKVWDKAAEAAAFSAECLMEAGLAKQWANRVLEPFLYVHGVVTATDWNNFFHLRRAADAQPEFKVLADLMYEAMEASEPKVLSFSEWHLPYVDTSGIEDWSGPLSLCVARCARVSVKPFDGNADLASEMKRADTLLANGHMSPFEHQATPGNLGEYYGNFYGWRQYRKILPYECIPG